MTPTQALASVLNVATENSKWSEPAGADELREALRRDWAARVLDAWAMAPERGPLLHPIPSPFPEWGNGFYVPWAGRRYYGDTPDGARLAAARAAWFELSESARANLGECP